MLFLKKKIPLFLFPKLVFPKLVCPRLMCSMLLVTQFMLLNPMYPLRLHTQNPLPRQFLPPIKS
jgi:hypothetical protein